MTFGEILKAIFAANGVKQGEAGERIGCGQSAVNHLLADRRSPTVNRIVPILEAFGYKVVVVPSDSEIPKGGFELTSSEQKGGD